MPEIATGQNGIRRPLPLQGKHNWAFMASSANLTVKRSSWCPDGALAVLLLLHTPQQNVRTPPPPPSLQVSDPRQPAPTSSFRFFYFLLLCHASLPHLIRTRASDSLPPTGWGRESRLIRDEILCTVTTTTNTK